MCTYPDRLRSPHPERPSGRTRHASAAAPRRGPLTAGASPWLQPGLGAGLLLLSLGLWLGCAARPPAASTPLQTLSRYREALQHDDPKAAYALLSPGVQQGLAYEQFAQQWQDTKAERGVQAMQLSQALARPGTSVAAPRPDAAGPGAAASPAAAVSARAVLTLPQGGQLILAPAAARFLAGQSSAWHVLDPDLRAVRAQTPEAALRLLLAAAEQRNYPALLRLLTKSERQSLEAELAERIERLRAHLSRGQPIETTAERARLQYDPRFFIDLRREQDGWRIADFN